MNDLCFITTCKGRLEHLQRTLPRIAGQAGVHCVVVDYSCPDGTAAWVENNFPQVRIVRVEGEAGFNASRARNIGARAAKEPWLMFFDADILLATDFASSIRLLLKPGFFYRAEPMTTQTWGSIICRSEDFNRIGGYDECYSGWGGEDDDLRVMLSSAGCAEGSFPGTLLGEIAHSDALRTRYFDIKDRRVEQKISSLYLQAKLDVMRVLGKRLPLDVREALHGQARHAILTAPPPPAVMNLEVNLPSQQIMPAPYLWRIDRKLVFSMVIPEGQPPE